LADLVGTAIGVDQTRDTERLVAAD
jgi:hypothetical protein